jgi:hypothetical protein
MRWCGSASNADSDPDLDATPSFTHVEKSYFFTLLFTAAPVYVVLSFRLRHSLIGVIPNSQYFGQYIKIFCKKCID